jgi:SAM-dependent methyltransferase
MTSPPYPFSPAAERNRVPILDVLRSVLPERATVLEIASGTGQHAEHFAASEPGWTWQPSEVAADALPAIAARCTGLPNVLPPLVLDVLAQPWAATLGRFDALFCANMLHISPEATSAALVRAAMGHLEPTGRLVVYGPFIVDGEATSPGNLAFDADLRARDPAWGLRRLGNLTATARAAGLAFVQRFDMPANNLALVFCRADAPHLRR